MAETEFGTDHALRVTKWSKALWQYARYKSFFSPYIGPNKQVKGVAIQTSDNAMIQLKMDLKKDEGDKVVFGMAAPLRGAGVAGDNELEKHEEAMTFYDWDVELKQTRHAVTNKGRLDNTRTVFDLKLQAKDKLGEWLMHRIDNYTGCALAGVASNDGNVAANAPSNGMRKWCGGQTAADVLYHNTGNLDAAFDATTTNNLFGTKVIEAVKRKAYVLEPCIRPIIIDGRDWYVMFIHPLQAKALKASTAWKNGSLYADVRGMKNKLFTGALGAWDGVVLHEYQKIETRLGAGGSTASEYFDSGDVLASGDYAARALFCGAQACVQAWNKLPFWNEDSFDYDNRWGIAAGAIVGVSKPEFNSEDYGVITVDTEIVAD